MVQEPIGGWVKARSNCSLESVFADITAAVKNDVAQRMEIKQSRYEQINFQIPDDPSGNPHRLRIQRFSKEASGESLEFTIEAGKICAKLDGREILSASISLNDEGRCVLKAGDQELEQWQFRRRALEEFFKL